MVNETVFIQCADCGENIEEETQQVFQCALDLRYLCEYCAAIHAGELISIFALPGCQACLDRIRKVAA